MIRHVCHVTGMVCLVGRSKDGGVILCDILLLRSSGVVNEAMLTGESVPQRKVEGEREGGREGGERKKEKGKGGRGGRK